MRKKKTKWKQFEEFTGRIEAALAPLGAMVKCPDHIADLDTGQLRQIDATLRFPAIASLALVGFECRDRGSRQDVRWIEELYGKQKSIGATLMVAVSSQPFYGPAIKKAAALGIELRVMTPAAADDFAAWLKTTGISMEISEFEIGTVQVELYSGRADEPFDELQGKPFQDSPAFMEVATQRRLSISQIVDQMRGAGRWLKPAILPNDGSEMKCTQKVLFGPNMMQVSAGGRMQDVRGMLVDLVWTKKTEFVPFARVSSYASPEKLKAESVEADLEGVTLGIHRDPATDQKHIRFDSQQPARVVSVTDEEAVSDNGVATRRRTFKLQMARPKSITQET